MSAFKIINPKVVKEKELEVGIKYVVKMNLTCRMVVAECVETKKGKSAVKVLNRGLFYNLLMKSDEYKTIEAYDVKKHGKIEGYHMPARKDWPKPKKRFLSWFKWW